MRSAASRPFSTPVWKRWPAIPTAACRRSLAARGVVRATIYVHFPTRESLLDAVMEYATDQVVEAMRGAEPHRGDPVEALERGAPSDLAPTRAVPRSPRTQHRAALCRRTPPASRAHARPARAPDRTRPEAGRLPQRSPRLVAARRDPLARACRKPRDPGGRIPESEAEAAMLSTIFGAIGSAGAANEQGRRGVVPGQQLLYGERRCGHGSRLRRSSRWRSPAATARAPEAPPFTADQRVDAIVECLTAAKLGEAERGNPPPPHRPPVNEASSSSSTQRERPRQ